MLAPIDLEQKTFSKALSGYKVTEVEDFLEEVIAGYERLYQENVELRERAMILQEQIAKYDDLELTLKNTLVLAQQTSERLNMQATDKADMVINEAQRDAEKIINEARMKAVELTQKSDLLKKELFVFEAKFTQLLQNQSDFLKSNLRALQEEPGLFE
jgi:cell division initiation protein